MSFFYVNFLMIIGSLYLPIFVTLIQIQKMAKSRVAKNGANKKLHTKLRKRKKAKLQSAKEIRKIRLKEIIAAANPENKDSNSE